ncbi:hypothetical protein [Enterococcus sp. CWB-B31]|uniref:hypothetical protein n=1 Tax=Enterococcus sp. CWB-B31 TaxID=2885159 RepID=UPI001E654FFE|nr:hypothetical protein [Enterococcus sp. CWB-B31]MCB5954601.1 hypothetical protein [Enterococcus sp. CWB-B31]
MMDELMRNMYLVFLARQGYWSKEDEVSSKSLFYLTYQYLVISAVIFCVMLPFNGKIKELLESMTYKGMVSYYTLIVYGLYVILFLGIIYENYFIIQSNTINSLYIFFRVSIKQLRFIVFLKNLAIVLPAVLFLVFYQGIRVVVFFCIVHFLSLFFIPKLLSVRKRTKSKNTVSYRLPSIIVNSSYVYSILGPAFFLKNTFAPVFSLGIFVLLSFSSQNLIEIDNYLQAFIIGILGGSIFFQSKHHSFGFICLNHDFPFFKSLGMSVPNYANLIIRYLNLFQLAVVTMVLWLLNLVYFKWTDVNFLFVIVGLCLSFNLLNFGQLLLVEKIRELGFRKANELEAYKIPLKLRIPKYLINVYISIIVIVGNYFIKQNYEGIILIAVGMLFIVPVVVERKRLSTYLGEI